MSNTIRFEVDGGGIATLTLDNPGKPVNLVTPGFSAATSSSRSAST